MTGHRKSGRAEEELRSVDCGQYSICYVLTRKPVKNINLRIKQDGKVSVSAGYRVPVTVIDDFIRSRHDFILRAVSNFTSREKLPQLSGRYENGERMMLMGSCYQLAVVQGASQGVCISGDSVILTVRDIYDQKQKERCMKKWMVQMQSSVFEKICREIYPIFREFGVHYPEIKIRTMKTMWGSCRPERGIITLNSRLIETPAACIRYVVLHEFSHFIHPDHSADFYRLVETYMPDYKIYKKELARFSI